jgi:predicted TIM-barrel fold metal-dependent hydrolase
VIGNSALAKEFWQNGKSSTCPIIDMHGHMGSWYAIYFPRGEQEQMLNTMDECGVKYLVFSHHHALLSPEIGNQASIAAVRRYPHRFRAYCVINPNFPEKIDEDLENFEQHRDVYVGFKFLSDYHHVPITNARYRPALEYANQHQLLVLMHTWGGSPYDGAELVAPLAERYPEATFLLGHSCHGDWDAAVVLANHFPNVFLELTAIFDDRGILEKFAAEAGSERMLFGTDLPWFDPHQAVGALFSAHLSDEDIHNICHRNAEKLIQPFISINQTKGVLK